MDDEPRGIRALARRVPLWLWLPAPGALAHVLVLLLSRRVWTTHVEVNSRTGRSGQSVAAHVYVVMLAIMAGGYVATGLAGDDAWGRGGRGLRPPTPPRSRWRAWSCAGCAWSGSTRAPSRC